MLRSNWEGNGPPPHTGGHTKKIRGELLEVISIHSTPLDMECTTGHSPYAQGHTKKRSNNYFGGHFIQETLRSVFGVQRRTLIHTSKDTRIRSGVKSYETVVFPIQEINDVFGVEERTYTHFVGHTGCHGVELRNGHPSHSRNNFVYGMHKRDRFHTLVGHTDRLSCGTSFPCWKLSYSEEYGNTDSFIQYEMEDRLFLTLS